jgi:hypothetical protein
LPTTSSFRGSTTGELALRQFAGLLPTLTDLSSGGSRMSQNLAGKWVRRAVCCTLAAIFPVGCNPFATYSGCTFSDPIRHAEYPLVFKDGPKKGKDVLVALFIATAPKISPVFAGSEEKLASEIAKKLAELAKEEKQKLVVLDPSQVHKFKLKTLNWNHLHASELGKKLGVDYVLVIQLDKMSLYQPNSQDQQYQGQAEATVDVYDVDAGPTEPKYHYVYQFKYPHTGALDATAIPLNRFKQDFMEHLAAELSKQHVTHREASEIAEDK